MDSRANITKGNSYDTRSQPSGDAYHYSNSVCGPSGCESGRLLTCDRTEATTIPMETIRPITTAARVALPILLQMAMSTRSEIVALHGESDTPPYAARNGFASCG